MKTRIYDTFNRTVVSNHKSLKSAVRAADKIQPAVRRANGPNSYLPTRIEYLTDDDQWIGVPGDQIDDARQITW